MADLAAPVVDGKVNLPESESAQKTKKSNSTLDKDAFLQLLVAQMKYQDPLEPTSNTEYVAQLATFSQLEEMQNMTASLNLQRASSLIGKYVSVNVVDSTTGKSSTISGRVEYVETQNGKSYLYIEGKPYSIDDLNTVWDEEYLAAMNLAEAWVNAVNALPKPDEVTLDHKDSVLSLTKAYASVSDYQRSFLPKESVEKLEKAYERLVELDPTLGSGGSTDGTEDTDKTEPGDTESEGTGTDTTGSETVTV